MAESRIGKERRWRESAQFLAQCRASWFWAATAALRCSQHQPQNGLRIPGNAGPPTQLRRPRRAMATTASENRVAAVASRKGRGTTGGQLANSVNLSGAARLDEQRSAAGAVAPAHAAPSADAMRRNRVQCSAPMGSGQTLRGWRASSTGGGSASRRRTPDSCPDQRRWGNEHSHIYKVPRAPVIPDHNAKRRGLHVRWRRLRLR